MESFVLFRNYLAMGGIHLQPSPQNSHRFNVKNFTVIFFATIGGILINKLTNEAKSFEEYADIVYRGIFVYMLVTIYAYIVWKAQILSGFVYRLEDGINKSKFSIGKNYLGHGRL